MKRRANQYNNQFLKGTEEQPEPKKAPPRRTATPPRRQDTERESMLLEQIVLDDPTQLRDYASADKEEVVLAVVVAAHGRVHADALRRTYAAAAATQHDGRADKDVMLAAVARDGSRLEVASDELRSDRDVVLTAVNNDGFALEYASETLRSDRQIVLSAVNTDGSALQYAAEVFRSDREVVLDAVNANGWALHFASDELRSDREVVLAAVNSYGIALLRASVELRSDPEVVLAAVKNTRNALKFAMGGLLDCTTSKSVGFMETFLQILLENDAVETYWMDSIDDFPQLKAVLIDLSQKLKEVDDSSIRGDVMPDVLARRWIARINETQWCLARVCQNAAVSMDAQQSLEQFTNIPRDFQTARQLLTYSRIIYLSMKLFGCNCSDPLDWQSFLSNVEQDGLHRF